jgi:hypothetical protein
VRDVDEIIGQPAEHKLRLAIRNQIFQYLDFTTRSLRARKNEERLALFERYTKCTIRDPTMQPPKLTVTVLYRTYEHNSIFERKASLFISGDGYCSVLLFGIQSSRTQQQLQVLSLAIARKDHGKRFAASRFAGATAASFFCRGQ